MKTNKTDFRPENRDAQEATERTEIGKAKSVLCSLCGLLFSAIWSRSALCALCVLLWQSTLADVHYVDVTSINATPPYTNWTTAATNIQDAVDAAVAGDEVVVTNGVYATGSRTLDGSTFNRVVVNKPLSVRSVNGPQATTIDGGKVRRCAYLTDGAALSGFTLRNGYESFASSSYTEGGAGVRCVSSNSVVSNCVIRDNQAFGDDYSRSPLHIYGGGAYGGTLNNCTLVSNSVSVRILVYIPNGGQSISGYGGGAARCTLNNCTLRGNSATATNFVDGYTATTASAEGGGAYGCTLNNCILSGNFVAARASYIYRGSKNYALAGYPGAAYGTLNNCCGGDPLFVDGAAGNFRLQSNSPCINAGNNSYITNATDLDGNPRIAGGTVDIGAYEYQSPVSQISYAWLQQYGLPINSATDTADPDGDGVDNYHEWLAGTNPNNALSSPAQLTIAPSGVPPSGVILRWSTNAVGFTLQSAPALAGTFTNLPAATSPYTNSIVDGQKYFRLISY